MYIRIGCGGQLNTPNTLITSPSYPENYPKDIQCIWSIVAPPGARIRLQLISLDLEVSPGCVYDRIDIIDSDATLIERFVYELLCINCIS